MKPTIQTATQMRQVVSGCAPLVSVAHIVNLETVLVILMMVFVPLKKVLFTENFFLKSAPILFSTGARIVMTDRTLFHKKWGKGVYI
jgi:hypothetical protein